MSDLAYLNKEENYFTDPHMILLLHYKSTEKQEKKLHKVENQRLKGPLCVQSLENFY